MSTSPSSPQASGLKADIVPSNLFRAGACAAQAWAWTTHATATTIKRRRQVIRISDRHKDKGILFSVAHRDGGHVHVGVITDPTRTSST